MCISTLIESFLHQNFKVDIYSCVTLEIILNLSEPPFPLSTVLFMQQSNIVDCICWIVSRGKGRSYMTHASKLALDRDESHIPYSW